MNVLVVGATGRNSGLVVPELTRRGVAVRAMVRRADQKAGALAAGSQEAVVADLRDPASLAAAVDGVDGVFHVNPAFAADEAAMGVSMVRAARAAGVRRFVFSSVYHPSISAMVNHAAKQPVEEALYESGLQFTILQPAMFMQNLAGALPAAARSGVFSMPFSKHAKVCYVDYRDVAEAAALGLTGDTLAYGTFELCAPGMVDRVEIAALMSTALGRTITAEESPPRDPGPDADAMQQGLARMTRHYDQHGFPGGNGLVLGAVLGRPPRTLQEFLVEHAKPTNTA